MSIYIISASYELINIIVPLIRIENIKYSSVNPIYLL